MGMLPVRERESRGGDNTVCEVWVFRFDFFSPKGLNFSNAQTIFKLVKKFVK